MKKANKQKIAVVALATVATLGVGGYLASTAVNAADSTTRITIAEKIAEKFNLNQDEVEAVFTQDREERETSRLEHAVENGVITEDQVSAIEAKQEEFRADMDDLNAQELTTEERHDAVKALMDEYSTWAEENDIPVGMVAGGPKGQHSQMGGRMGQGMMDEDFQGMGMFSEN